MIKNYLKSAIAIIALAFGMGLSASAQSSQISEKTLPVGEFNAVDISGNFDVTISRGAYSTRLTVDKQAAEYVEVYVRSKVLHISYNEDAIPKEKKKELTGKNASKMVFRVIVYCPELNGVTMSDNAVLSGTDEFNASGFSLNLTDKAQVKNLSVMAPRASVYMRDKAQATLILNADNDIDLKTEASAKLNVSLKCRKLNVKAISSSSVSTSGDAIESVNLETEGSSKVAVSTHTDLVTVNANNRSDISLSGSAMTLNVKGDKNMKVDALFMPVPEVTTEMAGGELRTKVDKVLNVNISGGSEVYYEGEPEIRITRVLKSTLAPAGKK